MKEKLKKLPAEIQYKLPTFATGLGRDREKYLNQIWTDETDIYHLTIWKTEEENWEIAYIRDDPYEGGPDVLLPAKPDEEVLEIIKKEYDIKDDEIGLFIGSQTLFKSSESTDLEDAVDKVLEWLEKEGLLE